MVRRLDGMGLLPGLPGLISPEAPCVTSTEELTGQSVWALVLGLQDTTDPVRDQHSETCKNTPVSVSVAVAACHSHLPIYIRH